MKTRILIVLCLAGLLLPAGLFAQAAPATPDQTQPRGSIELGVRNITGDVYGRPDLPFQPSLTNSKFNEYRDLRNGLYVRGMSLKLDNVMGTRYYLNVQSQSWAYKDQSYLATFGDWGHLKVQFRYDEIPHTFSDTTRSLYTEINPGQFVFPTAVRGLLQNTTAANLPSVVATQVTNNSQPFLTLGLIRRKGTGLVSWDVTPDWNLNFSFARENEVGKRPIGQIMNSSPSASSTAGFGAELPEPIDYFIDTLKFGTEYGKKGFAFQANYLGSFFMNNIHSLLYDNPFRLSTEQTTNPLTGRATLYPDNHASTLNFAGGFDLGKRVRVIASVSPEWMRQNQAFFPYTTNTATNTCGSGTQSCSSTASLPASSLNGQKTTIAANTTVVAKPVKNVELKFLYRDYDYINNTPVHAFTEVMGDAAAPTAPTENDPFAFNRQNVEATGTWFFSKKSSVKLGYEGEFMDRTHRDAEHSKENGFVGALDLNPNKLVLFRLSYRHSDRKPDEYLNDLSLDLSGGLPADQPNHRRFDEAARVRDRVDALLQYNATDRLTLSGSYGTVQDNYNQRGGSNSASALNFLSTTQPYYLYGVLKDISYNYNFDADYALSTAVSMFAEYSREKYNKSMVSRYRVPGSGSPVPTPADCSISGRACDSANNDWNSSARDIVDTYAVGFDMYLGKKTYLTTYYTLAAGKGNVLSDPLGDPTITTGPNKFLLTGTNAAVDYPETTTRSHEVGFILKYKLTKNLTPKFEYRYQQFDNRDYQTSPMTQYMGCVSPVPNGPPVTNAVIGCTTPILNTNTFNPTAVSSQFYPYFVVGDTSAARYLFLGVDQPSYRAHMLQASLTYTW